MKLLRKILRQKDSERGASLVEYSLLIALIAVLCLAGLRAVGTQSKSTFQRVAANMGATAGHVARPLRTHGYSAQELP